jgi:mono/diheme cytochrome c family protein
MKLDFRSCMLLTLFGLPLFLLLFIAALYFLNCGTSGSCTFVSQATIIHTPIPTLIPATLPAQVNVSSTQPPAECSASARTLLSSWVNTGFSDTQLFQYTDIYGNVCQATFADLQALFTQANLWYDGALACVACHNSDIAASAARLDLSTYAGILAGSQRTSSTATGVDILGGGVWQDSLLNQMLFLTPVMPFGHPAGAGSPDGPTISAGSLATIPTATPQEAPPQEEVARPSNPGGSGEAVNLTGDPVAGQKVFVDHCQLCHGVAGTDNVLNPGSDDGTIPPLNPIDPTLVNSDYKTFAYNLDLFLQNGSVAEGPNAAFQMPAWGAEGGLTQQQIADVIAYLISINP